MPLIPVECLLSSSTIDTYHVPIYTPALQFIQNTNVYPYLHVSYMPSQLYTWILLATRPLTPLAFSTAFIRSFLAVVIYEIYG